MVLDILNETVVSSGGVSDVGRPLFDRVEEGRHDTVTKERILYL